MRNAGLDKHEAGDAVRNGHVSIESPGQPRHVERDPDVLVYPETDVVYLRDEQLPDASVARQPFRSFILHKPRAMNTRCVYANASTRKLRVYGLWFETIVWSAIVEWIMSMIFSKYCAIHDCRHHAALNLHHPPLSVAPETPPPPL